MNKAQKLDKLLSTKDSGFNHAMQVMIWKHTPDKVLFPDAGIIEYMEVLHDVFFFCLDNYRTPYACIGRMGDIADNDEYLLALVDSILHLISQSDRGHEDGMRILYGQLVDFGHKLAPWDEDENVKITVKEMEETNRQKPAPATSAPAATDEQGLTNRERILIHCYESGRVINKGEPDYNDYITFATSTKRKSYPNNSGSKAKSLIRSIRKIIPHLSQRAVQQANSEIDTIEANLVTR